ncbi:hypothetical protein H4R34_003177 [Dimargaris verticillata]|uniref:ABC transporter domain-containing protein n=1 Tax=Dimargaris verticillata TaxID=2761393 RepID=A0A9W8B2N7_9FUNG|nr:hypothetical protein H4R34_003177 [Dimargaris verticillata]
MAAGTKPGYSPSQEALLPKEKPPTYTLNWLMVKRLWRITRIQLSSTATPYPSAVLPMVLLIAVACGTEVVVYFNGQIPSKYYKVLVGKTESDFYPLVGESLALVIATAACNAIVKFISGTYQVRTRRLLSHYVQVRYLQPQTLYPLVADNLVDNPDQRITQDIDKFARASADLLRALIISPALIVYYSWQCWDVSGAIGPLLVYFVFLVGVAITRFLMTPVISLVYAQEQQEGVYRFNHVHLRAEAQAIALQGGEHDEQLKINRSLLSIVYWQRNLVQRTFWLDLATETWAYVGAILSYLIISIPIFTGTYDDMDSASLSELISRYSFLSMYLISVFSNIVQKAAVFSELTGYVARIGQLLETMEALNGPTFDPAVGKPRSGDQAALLSDISAPTTPTSITPNFSPEPLSPEAENLEVQALGYTLPSGRTLFHNLSFTLVPGQNMLLNGPNGSGKSSLARLLAGIWLPAAGVVTIPASTTHRPGLMVCPQLPYLTQGTLHDQLVYPNPYLTAANAYEPSPTFVTRLWYRYVGRWLPSTTQDRHRQPDALENRSSTDSFLVASGGGTESSANSVQPSTTSVPKGSSVHVSHRPPDATSRGSVGKDLVDCFGKTLTNTAILDLLRTVGLDRIARTIDPSEFFTVPQWEQLLSPGEQQRLVFARLFACRPQFAVIDEGTSAMGSACAQELYQHAQDLGITLITISHQTDLMRFHQRQLTLYGDGTHTLTTLEPPS